MRVGKDTRFAVRETCVDRPSRATAALRSLFKKLVLRRGPGVCVMCEGNVADTTGEIEASVFSFEASCFVQIFMQLNMRKFNVFVSAFPLVSRGVLVSSCLQAHFLGLPFS